MKIGYIVVLALVACHPRIYRFEVSAKALGLHDPYSVKWRTKGSTYLTIYDTSMPYTAAPAVPPVMLLVSRDGRSDTLSLRRADTLWLPEQGSLSIRNLPDGDSTPRFRYMRFVAHKCNKDSTREAQIAFFPGEAFGAVGFIANPRGDSLVAEGNNDDARRWGGLFRILAVANDTSGDGAGEAPRDLVVTHAGITTVLHPGGAPSFVFSGTPIGGWWSIRGAMTEAEKKDVRKVPNGLHVRIIVKHI
ncbi:MAG TPA: hypothetical protein VGS79_03015 [Puia sp.]|nr:hypothetical protein [Puia sp.]